MGVTLEEFLAKFLSERLQQEHDAAPQTLAQIVAAGEAVTVAEVRAGIAAWVKAA